MATPTKLETATVELLRRFGRVDVGATITGRLAYDDMEIEIVATVRRRQEPSEIQALRARAMELLTEWTSQKLIEEPIPPRAPLCECYSQRRGRGAFSSGGHRCGARVEAAIAYRPGLYGPVIAVDHGNDSAGRGTAFLFVCGRHLAHHHVDPKVVLAAVQLPARRLAELRRDYDRRVAARDRQWSAEQDERERKWRGQKDGAGQAALHPPCAISMGCLCAAHARGADLSAPCNASE